MLDENHADAAPRPASDPWSAIHVQLRQLIAEQRAASATLLTLFGDIDPQYQRVVDAWTTIESWRRAITGPGSATECAARLALLKAKTRAAQDGRLLDIWPYPEEMAGITEQVADWCDWFDPQYGALPTLWLPRDWGQHPLALAPKSQRFPPPVMDDATDEAGVLEAGTYAGDPTTPVLGRLPQLGVWVWERVDWLLTAGRLWYYRHQRQR